jgi:hypothetical protein
LFATFGAFRIEMNGINYHQLPKSGNSLLVRPEKENPLSILRLGVWFVNRKGPSITQRRRGLIIRFKASPW